MGIRPAGGRNNHQKKEEMKKLTADQWRSLLYKFTEDEGFYPGLQHPFKQDGYVCATDTHAILRVDKDLIPKSNDDYVPKHRVPTIAKVMPTSNPTFTISLKEIQSCLVALGLNYDHLDKECPGCGGSGDVDWYYTDRDGYTHTKMDDCPYCGGSGCIKNGSDRYCSIGDMVILAYHMILVQRTMTALGIDTLRCTWHRMGKRSLLLNFADGVDIVVATMPIPELKKHFPIKIEEL